MPPLIATLFLVAGTATTLPRLAAESIGRCAVATLAADASRAAESLDLRISCSICKAHANKPHEDSSLERLDLVL
eukprot:jgi/Chlat1/7655/Chrsp64S07169